MASLNDLMEFGVIVRSDGQGNVVPADQHDNFDEVSVVVDADGQIILPERFEQLPAGWKLLTGFSGQDSYHGAVLHSSEFIGGGLETYIRDTAGLYAAITIGCAYPDNRWWITNSGDVTILDTVTAPTAAEATARAASALDKTADLLEASPAEEADDAGWGVAYRAE